MLCKINLLHFIIQHLNVAFTTVRKSSKLIARRIFGTYIYSNIMNTSIHRRCTTYGLLLQPLGSYADEQLVFINHLYRSVVLRRVSSCCLKTEILLFPLAPKSHVKYTVRFSVDENLKLNMVAILRLQFCIEIIK